MSPPKIEGLPLYAQLPLGVRLREAATFANYYSGGNGDTVRLLQDAAVAESERFIYLWGAHGAGKTHLLQAQCHLAAAQGHAVAYLPLKELAVISPEEILEGLEHLPLVIVDDIDAAAGQAHWETALFHLHNRIRERDGRLIMAGLRSPAALGITLADLRSRVAGGLVLQIHALRDEEKSVALRLQARQMGMDMPEEVAVYLLRHCPRDMTALFALLEVLDQASLAAQRKLTIPFVKEVLQQMAGAAAAESS